MVYSLPAGSSPARLRPPRTGPAAFLEPVARAPRRRDPPVPSARPRTRDALSPAMDAATWGSFELSGPVRAASAAASYQGRCRRRNDGRESARSSGTERAREPRDWAGRLRPIPQKVGEVPGTRELSPRRKAGRRGRVQVEAGYTGIQRGAGPKAAGKWIKPVELRMEQYIAPDTGSRSHLNSGPGDPRPPGVQGRTLVGLIHTVLSTTTRT